MTGGLRSFVASAGQVLATGGALVAHEEYDRRLVICATCDQRDTTREGIACVLCGCNMRLKARFSGVDCPHLSEHGEPRSKWLAAA